MTRLEFRTIVLMAHFLVAGCTTADSTSSNHPARQVETVNGIAVELIATDWRGGVDAWATLCYELPTDSSWLMGRLSGDVILSEGSTIIPMSSIELIGWTIGPDGVPNQRCDRVRFQLSAEPNEGFYTLTVRRISADLPVETDWAELQSRLDAAGTGIRIEPLSDAEAFSFALISKPERMSDLEAQNVVIGMAGEVVEGPWTFTFRLR